VRRSKRAKSVGRPQNERSGKEALVRVVGRVERVLNGLTADTELPGPLPAHALRRWPVAKPHVTQPFPETEAIEQMQHHSTAGSNQPRSVVGEARQVR
jgi:hypothetical protein